jgi:hypothetical protein
MSSLINHPHVEMVPRERLRSDPKGPRKHPKKQIEQIARIIGRVGFLVPIIADETGLIVAGVGRWAAAAQLNLEEVPVIRASFVTDEDRRAFALADNRISELSEWDEDLLREQLEHLFEHDYDLTLTGFELADLDLGVPASAEEEAEPEPPEGPPISRPGDLWEIGPTAFFAETRATVSATRRCWPGSWRRSFSPTPRITFGSHTTSPASA